MARKFLCVYYDQAKTWNSLDDDARGRLLSALLEYAENGTEPDLSGPERYVWHMMADQVDKNNANYDRMIQQRINAGRQSGISRNERKRTKTNENEHPLTDVQSDERKRTSVDNNNNNNSNNIKSKKFVPPTKEEVRAFAKERNSPVDPDKFFEYFDVGEWKDSKGNQVLNWKQKLITWEKYKEKDLPTVDANGKRVFKDYQDQLEHDMSWTKRLYQGGGYDR